MRAFAVIVVVTVTAAAAGTAQADRDATPAARAPVAFHTTVDAAGHRRIVIDTPVEISARPPAPAVAILHPAPQLDYQWPASIDSFMPLIVASVRAQPFTAQVQP